MPKVRGKVGKYHGAQAVPTVKIEIIIRACPTKM